MIHNSMYPVESSSSFPGHRDSKSSRAPHSLTRHWRGGVFAARGLRSRSRCRLHGSALCEPSTAEPSTVVRPLAASSGPPADMWSPGSFAEALPLCVVSLVCWGSWSNSAKEAGFRKVPFPHFYL
jgi:hypothetical protein